MLSKSLYILAFSTLATLTQSAALSPRSYEYTVYAFENRECVYKEGEDGYRRLLIQGQSQKSCTAFGWDATAFKSGGVVGDWAVRFYEDEADCKDTQGLTEVTRDYPPTNGVCVTIGDSDTAATYWNVLDNFEPPATKTTTDN